MIRAASEAGDSRERPQRLRAQSLLLRTTAQLARVVVAPRPH